jgi:hypothetical protein
LIGLIADKSANHYEETDEQCGQQTDSLTDRFIRSG